MLGFWFQLNTGSLAWGLCLLSSTKVFVFFEYNICSLGLVKFEVYWVHWVLVQFCLPQYKVSTFRLGFLLFVSVSLLQFVENILTLV